MGATVAEMIESVMSAMDGKRIWEVMRDDEAQRGYQIIVPGDAAWLSTDDWDETIVVSQDGKEVRLIAILAKQPGRGAFRRTLAGILDAGLKPVVLAPTRELKATLTRWRWFQTIRGSGWTREDQWRPRKGWRP